MNEAKRPKISKWVYEVMRDAGRPITRKAIVLELKHRGREVSRDQLGTALSNMRGRKQLVVTGKKLKKFSVSELPVAPWDRDKEDVDTKESPVQFSLKQVEMKDVVVHQPETAPIEVKMSGQESLMLVYMRVKIASMVLCTGAVAGLAAVLAMRLYS
tara:strand:- start:223 stop:693 length:471 start_codon:yes stop_codon:yes gene_type:complete